jgi:hypothetical protein
MTTMPFALDLRHEALNYTGSYAQPALELWGHGGAIIKGLLGALGQHGVTFSQIQASGTSVNASDTVVVAIVPSVGTVTFGFDRLEFKFANFTEDFFSAIPQTMERLVEWLRGSVSDFKFSAHKFSYSSHSFVRDATPQHVLKKLNVQELINAGINVGSGAIFNYTVPSKKWETQLLIDKSKYLAGGLFISLDLVLHSGEIDYSQLISDGRDYLATVLGELGIVVPGISGKGLS